MGIDPKGEYLQHTSGDLTGRVVNGEIKYLDKDGNTLSVGERTYEGVTTYVDNITGKTLDEKAVAEINGVLNEAMMYQYSPEYTTWIDHKKYFKRKNKNRVSKGTISKKARKALKRNYNSSEEERDYDYIMTDKDFYGNTKF